MNEGIVIQGGSNNPFAEQKYIWEDILRNWIRMVVKYCNHLDGEEAPYYFSERANVGLLAAAAWQSGCVALEEFQADKICPENGRRNGRVDLWIGAGEKSYWLEAKLGWPKFQCSKDELEETIELAKRDAEKLDVYKHEHRVALTFLAPEYSIGDTTTPEEKIKIFLEQIEKTTCQAKAWVFPSAARSLKGHNGNFYPGVAVLLERIRHPYVLSGKNSAPAKKTEQAS